MLHRSISTSLLSISCLLFFSIVSSESANRQWTTMQQNVAERRLSPYGQQQQQQNSVELISEGNNNPRHAHQQPAESESDEQTVDSPMGTDGKDLFGDYLNRGMISCATQYVAMLQKLNQLIVRAHREYKQCQHEMDRTVLTPEQAKKLSAQLALIDQLFSDE